MHYVPATLRLCLRTLTRHLINMLNSENEEQASYSVNSQQEECLLISGL